MMIGILMVGLMMGGLNNTGNNGRRRRRRYNSCLLFPRCRPGSPYCPYGPYGLSGRGSYFIGDFRDVNEIKNLP